jgi:cob(I)alamin adenosyltransferase
VEQFGSPECIPLRDPPEAADVARAVAGLDRCAAILSAGNHPLVILDEISVAVRFGLIAEAALLDLVTLRPKQVELVCTGRYAPASLLERADLVTEMRCLRHPTIPRLFRPEMELRDNFF